MGLMDEYRQRIDRRLDALTAGDADTASPVIAAMRHALLAPGKRLRPVITMLISAQLGHEPELGLDPGCAIEMVHTSSLVFDDLPAMDDAALRRGRPTVHKAFGHDVAILAGIALLNDAFGVIADARGLSSQSKVELTALLARAVGSKGLVGGQFLDLHERASDLPADRLEHINALKTAALFVAAADAGAVVAGGTATQRLSAANFGLELGLAFQLADDLIDDPAYAGTTGKDVNQDRNKPTVASTLGVADTRQRLAARIAAARRHLAAIGGDAAPLNHILTSSFGRFLP
ncbi:MAG: hypothetical protein RL291_2016 [Pseudomonadota bacterium]